MANVLGSLLVLLRADTAEFTVGMAKASNEAKKTGHEIEESFSHLGGVISGLLAPFGNLGQAISSALGEIGDAVGSTMSSTAALGGVAVSAAAGIGAGFAAAAAGALELAHRAAEVGTSIFKASEVTGLTAAHLSGLRAATLQTGESFESLTTALARAGKNLQTAIQDPSKKAAEVFVNLMGSAQKLEALGLKPMDDRLQIILQRIFKLSDTGDREIALQKLLGKGWQSNIETLKMLAEEGYDPLVEKAQDLHQYYDAERAEEAHRFDESWNDLKATFSGIADDIGSSLIPSFTSLFTTLAYGSEVIAGLAHQTEQMQGDMGRYGVSINQAGQLFTKQDVATRNAAEAATEFHDKTLNSVDAIKQQVAELNASSAGLSKIQVTVAGAKTATDDLTDSTKKHQTALERAAAASREFWAEFNAGLKQAETHFPHVLSMTQEIDKALHPGEIQMPTGAWRNLPSFTPPEMRMPGGMPPGGDIFPTLGQSAEQAIAPITDFGRAFRLALQVPMARPITQLDQLKVGFHDFFTDVEAEGADFQKKVFDAMKTAIADLSSQLAQLVVTGRANFKELAKSFEESVLKAGFEQVLGKAAGGLSKAIFGKSAAGGAGQLGDSPQNPIYTYDVSSGGSAPGAGGGLLGKLLHTSSSSSDEENGGGEGGSEGGGGGAAGFVSDLAGLMGMQHGGDVRPGRAYIVGERRPELFVPREAGEIRPSISGGTTHQTVLNFHVNGVQDFDSFKRSQSQIMAGLQNQLAMAYSRQR